MNCPFGFIAGSGQLTDDSTRRIFRSLVVILLVVLGGWTANAVMKLSMTPLGVSPFGQYLATIMGGWIVQAAAGVTAPVLYAFR
jgi:hypothetical protein